MWQVKEKKESWLIPGFLTGANGQMDGKQRRGNVGIDWREIPVVKIQIQKNVSRNVGIR